MKLSKNKWQSVPLWLGEHHRLSIAIVLCLATFCMLLAFWLVFRNGSELLSRESYNHVLTVQKEQLHDTVHNLVLDIDWERQFLHEKHSDWSQAQIDQKVQEDIYQRVHHFQFNADAYISVKKILNYNGGSRYAIRIMQPHNPSQEGIYVSTNSLDPHGKAFYKDELDEIRKNGSLFQVHHYTNHDTGKITERVSYSELYPAYDWIISMSIDADNLQYYTQQAEEQIMPALRGYMILFFLVMLGLVLLTIFLILHTDKEYFGTQNKELQQQINWDTLTSAHSRKYGTELLEREWQSAKNSFDACDTAVMMLDVDHFKEFNDQYGHAVGDAVLREVVLAVRRVSRSSDRIIRWGGDEFIGIFYGLKRSHTDLMIKKILHAVAEIRIPVGDTEVHVSVSMGFAFFYPNDKNVQAVLDRADPALYEAKKAGRGQGRTAD